LSYAESESLRGIYLIYAAIEKQLSDEEKKNLSYTEIKLTVSKYKLDGILTIPKDTENSAVVVMLQGSGS